MPRLFGAMLAPILAIGAIATLLAPPASAAVDAAEPTQLIQSVATNLSDNVQTKSGSERESAMRALLRQKFDLGYMAATALGSHWSSATGPQKARLLAAFESAEARSYSDRMGRVPGATVKVGQATAKAPGVWMVDSRLVLPGGQSMKLDWEVREAAQGLKVSDIRVSGVSMFATRRADFDAYVRNHGGNVEPLIQVLEAKATR